MMKWNNLSKNEKVMIVLIITTIVAIILRWGALKDDIKDSFDPFLKHKSEINK